MVEYITIRGKKYPIRVSYLVLKNLKAEAGKVLENLTDGDTEAYEIILYWALVSGAMETQTEMTFKREDIEGALDSCFWELISTLPKFFPSVPLKEVKEDAEEKK